LSLDNASVLESSIEEAPEGAYSLVIFRAFRPLDKKMYQSLDRLLAENGHLAAWKGKKEKIDEEMSQISEVTGDWNVIPAPVPFLDEHERHLITIARPEK
jgi:16S rRNA (guanine527-N7)-methyltransferase